jgi:integrase
MKQYPRPWKHKSGYYYFTYQDEKGRRLNKSTRETTKYEANVFIEKFIKGLEDGRSVGITLAKYCEPFYIWGKCPLIQHRLDENKSITRRHVRNQRGKLDKYILTDKTLTKIFLGTIKRGDIIDFRTRLRNKYTDSMTNKIMGVLKAILKEAYYRGEIDRDPTAGIGNIKVESRKPAIFSQEELNTLFEKLKDPRKRIAFLLMAETGMRRAEVLAVQWWDVDWENHIIIVQRAWRDRDLGLPKWNRKRKVVLTNRLQIELWDYFTDVLTCRPEDLVVCWDDGSPIGLRSINLWFNKALKDAGIDKAGRSPHSLRHTKVTHLRQSGVPLEVIQATIGHTDKKTTAGYTQYENSYLVDEIRRIEDE